jgi:glycosyltransferase involved in cell wall biosynthesis
LTSQRVLFVGDIHSSHAQSWIGLLDPAAFDVRCFALPSGLPRADFPPFVWSTFQRPDDRAPNRKFRSLAGRAFLSISESLFPGTMVRRNARWLARIVCDWKPDLVHTFGLFPAAELYLAALAQIERRPPKWVAQIRGGPDLRLNRERPMFRSVIETIFARCDAIIADNEANYRAAAELGCSASKFYPHGPVPGTGGMDIDWFAARAPRPPSARARQILIPKAYEHVQSKSLPMIEALRSVWSRIAPCRIVCCATDSETIDAIRMLPDEIRASVAINPRLPRRELLALILESRAVLAPSLMDGVPNVLYEAMAAGAVPIVSPIETLTPLFRDRESVLFARNLHPVEIGEAIVAAMGDDVLADSIAARNMGDVAARADRRRIAIQVADFYNGLRGGAVRAPRAETSDMAGGAAPGRRLKILFVGELHSTHARSWIASLPKSRYHMRALTLSDVVPQDDLRISVLCPTRPRRSTAARRFVDMRVVADAFSNLKNPPPALRNWRRRVFAELCLSWPPRIGPAVGLILQAVTAQWLRRVHDGWRPDIVHILGLTPAGQAVADILRGRRTAGGPRFVLQLRGGSDLALAHADPSRAPALAEAIRFADAIVTDNRYNAIYFARMGLAADAVPWLVVPGTGGIDVAKLASRRRDPPSSRRKIVVPKAYESPWSKGLPILQALKIAWPQIQPCEIELLMAVNELPDWVRLLPSEMAAVIRVHRHVEHDMALELLAEARVVLAPSLVDGTPNVMWEAMALGALPIVSPLPTITPIATEPDNVLFANNLDPDAIARQLIRAMRDDALVDAMAVNNAALVGRLADRAIVRPKIQAFYRAFQTTSNQKAEGSLDG